MGGISIWQSLIILVIIVLLFGTKKLRNLGGDLGSAIKSFKKGMAEDEADADKVKHQQESERVIDAEVKETPSNKDK